MVSPSRPGATGWEPLTVEHLQSLLPQYEIVRLIGRGGMGAIYEGVQANLDRQVAIKILPENLGEVAGDLNFAERFKLEAKSMAKLDHPGIISVYDFGETKEGQLYFVMEFIDGMDIYQYLQSHGGAVPSEHAVAIVAHVLDALGYAHKNGILHRDIKPPNVMIKSDGRVKLADFGLAKKLTDSGSPDSVGLTLTNVALGTPDYVAPEALEIGTVIDHRADLYSVGVMFYQLITGMVPRGNFRPPSGKVVGLDPRIDAIISRAMEADPNDRYQSAQEFRAAIDEILKSPVPGASADFAAGGVPGSDKVALVTDPQALAKKKRSNPLLVAPPKKKTVANLTARVAVQANPAAALTGVPAQPKKGNTGMIVAAVGIPLVALGIGLAVIFSSVGDDNTSSNSKSPGETEEADNSTNTETPSERENNPEFPLRPGGPKPKPGGKPGGPKFGAKFIDLIPHLDTKLTPALRVGNKGGLMCKPNEALRIDFDLSDRDSYTLDVILSTELANGFSLSIPVADRRMDLSVDIADKVPDQNGERYRVIKLTSGGETLLQKEYPETDLMIQPNTPERLIVKIKRDGVWIEIGDSKRTADITTQDLQYDWAPLVKDINCRGNIVISPFGPYAIHRVALLPPGAPIHPVDMNKFKVPRRPIPPEPLLPTPQ